MKSFTFTWDDGYGGEYEVEVLHMGRVLHDVVPQGWDPGVRYWEVQEKAEELLADRIDGAADDRYDQLKDDRMTGDA